MKLLFEATYKKGNTFLGEPLTAAPKPVRRTRTVPGFTARTELIGEGWGEMNTTVLRRTDNNRIIAFATDGGWIVGKWILNTMRIEDAPAPAGDYDDGFAACLNALELTGADLLEDAIDEAKDAWPDEPWPSDVEES